MPAEDTTHVDVLIVGAGPAGLMAAHALAQAGVKIKIIDMKPKSVCVGQADGIMPRTIEVFQSYGLADSLLKQANQVNMVAFYNHRDEGGISKTQSLPVIDEKTARYPFLLTLNQGAIEKIFIDALAERNILIDRPVRPTSLVLCTNDTENQVYPVTAVLEHLQPPCADVNFETVHAKFVIGADGAHSWCRKALGIEMEGEQTDHIWGAVDFSTTPEANFPDWRKICTINAANTTILLIPREQDKLRLYLDLGLEDGLIDTTTKRVVTQNIDAKKLLEIGKTGLQPFIIPPAEIEWWTCYIVGQRVANRFSVHKRAFIIGDACHTHSPKAGQGMNVSMNDAHNLAWKLVYVLRGWADVSLLDTYEFERRKFAQQLIEFDKWYEKGFSAKSRSELLKDKGQSVISMPESPWEAFRAFSGLTSGVGVQYDPSIITAVAESAASSLKIGQRLPPQIVLRAADSTPVEIQDVCISDTRFKVIVFTGDTTQPSQRQLLDSFVQEVITDSGLFRRYGSQAFDFIAVLKGDKATVDYLQVPTALRFDYHKVLLDDVEVTGKNGGKMYDAYGISPEGAVVVVRPDGYVAMAVTLSEGARVNNYFLGFTKL